MAQLGHSERAAAAQRFPDAPTQHEEPRTSRLRRDHRDPHPGARRRARPRKHPHGRHLGKVTRAVDAVVRGVIAARELGVGEAIEVDAGAAASIVVEVGQNDREGPRIGFEALIGRRHITVMVEVRDNVRDRRAGVSPYTRGRGPAREC